jgi:hypothetical protein
LVHDRDGSGEGNRDRGGAEAIQRKQQGERTPKLLEPPSLAALIFTLAKEGGFSEAELMEMPVYRMNAYYHAALRSHDCWTVKPSAPAESQIDNLLAFAAAAVDIEEEE